MINSRFKYKFISIYISRVVLVGAGGNLYFIVQLLLIQVSFYQIHKFICIRIENENRYRNDKFCIELLKII